MSETHEYRLGPGLRQAIMWGTIVTSFAGGFYFGWKAYSTWGLQTEVAILKEDSKVGKKILEFEHEGEKHVGEYARGVNKVKATSCGKLSIHELISVCNTKKPK